MIYSDPTDKQGILDLARYHVKADANKLPEAMGRAFINTALDDYLELSLYASGFWQVDDTTHGNENYTDVNIVNGTSAYLFPASLLTLDKMEVLDEDDQWIEVDVRQFPHAPSDLKDDNLGIPAWGWARGAYFHVFPTPNYDKTGGLRFHHSRAFNYWDGDDGDTPGIPSIHHKYLAIRCAYLYAVREGLKSVKSIGDLLVAQEALIKQHYSRRNRAVKKQFIPRRTPSY